MAEAIIRIQYDEAYLEKENTDLETEVQGWLQDSNINVISIEKS